MIRFMDLAAVNARQSDDLARAARRVIDSGWLILGAEVASFEREFAAFCGARFCVGVASGLDALILILRGHIELGNLRPGDEVIVPANTYIASVLAIVHAGLIPVLADPDESTFNLSAQTARDAAGAKTRAVMAVHLYGRAAPMSELRALCRERGWLLFADAAQAHGAALPESGIVGDAAGFSFYPSKNLGALGDGGAVATDDEALAQTVAALRNYGSRQKYRNELVGFNSRLDEMQAAFLRIKLPLLAADNARRREIAARYRATIDNPRIILPSAPQDEKSHVWHLFVVRCAARAKLIEHLRAAEIETLIHYPIPPRRQQAFAGSALARSSSPLADKLADEVLSLPMGPTLSDSEIDAVVRTVNCFSLSSKRDIQ